MTTYAQGVPEKQIEQMILKYLTARGIFCWKVDSVGYFDQKLKIWRKPSNPFRILGVPDINGIYKGAPFYIEVKTKTGVASKEQKAFIMRAQAEGAIAFIARSVEDVQNYMGV